jgi:tripartite-type tricarboxylate transporter receptor subunit TctC
MLSKRSFLIGLAATSLDLGGESHADEIYPNRMIKLIVPFPPGTNSEIVARVLSERLSAKFGQPVIVENRPGGAGGTVGAAAVAHAEPDGYTLLVTPPGPLVTAGTIYKNLGYDPGKDFAPVALLFSSPQLLAVHPSVPAKTLRDFVAHARATPGKLSFASPGHGTQPHLLGEMLKATAGIDIVHLPYRGPAAALTALVAGQAQIYFESSSLILPLAEAEKVRILAVAGEARIAQLPDVATTGEGGFPSLVGGFWSGIVAPARTSLGIVSRLNAAINEIMQSTDMQASLTKIGAQAKSETAQAFGAFIAAETQKWSTVIKAAGVKID